VTLPPIRTDLRTAKEDLDALGLTRLSAAAPEYEFDEARERLGSQAAAEDAYGCAFHERGHDVVPRRDAPNQRVWNLINKGEIFRRLAVNPIVLELAKHLLGEDVLLFSFTANIACKGGNAQPIHGDQLFAPPETPFPLIANCLWMLDDFVEENGATRVVPGSHHAMRWPANDEPVETVPATGARGTIMMFDGRLWHGTGANQTELPRRALLSAYCRPFVRQQENLTVSISPDALAMCSPELIALLGFHNWKGLGSVEGADLGSQRPENFSRELHPPVDVGTVA
jgi:ectoine hydroxylase-related dioxygenase (phytanoyl-CoA dioxygenase family)